MIFVIDDDMVMGECIVKACKGARMKKPNNRGEVQVFTNAIEAMEAINRGVMPELIFLDILLDGPDGFTFLNELVSYTDTVRIPVVVVTSLRLKDQNLSDYGVVGVLFKEQMYPEDIKAYVEKYTN